MSELKTKPGKKSVKRFLNALGNEKRKQDAYVLLDLLQELSGKPAVLWGDSIVGFGSYHYKYATGREGDWPITGFSPRKQNLSIYVMLGFSRYQALMDKLGKYKTGKSCLYVNKLEDIDMAILKKLLKRSVADMRKTYPCC